MTVSAFAVAPLAVDAQGLTLGLDEDQGPNGQWPTYECNVKSSAMVSILADQGRLASGGPWH